MLVDDADRATLEAELKETITKATKSGTTWTTDWDNMTLPIIAKRQKEKEEQQLKSKHEESIHKNQREDYFNKLNKDNNLGTKKNNNNGKKQKTAK